MTAPRATRTRGFRGVEDLLDGYALSPEERASLLEWARWEADIAGSPEVLAAALLLVKRRAAQVAELRAVRADR
jgi:hypothetical protein